MSFYPRPLIAWTEKGLYCEAGDFYIDPHRVVPTAVITHAHSDHARRGSARYITVSCGVGLLKSRIGKNIVVEAHEYREAFVLGSVRVSFHSAGHILGSSQVRVECLKSGDVWLASGDYKRDADPSCEPFEIVECDTFITEATFGTPKFVWPSLEAFEHGRAIAEWWSEMAAQKQNAVLFGYSLGKAQRILAELAPFAKRPVLIHDTVMALTECYRSENRVLAPTHSLSEAMDALNEGKTFQGELILAPPSVLKESWAEKFGTYQTAFASGWMQSQQAFDRTTGETVTYGRSYDRGFVMSDHADWIGLNRTIDECKAKRVFVQHRNGALIRHLKKRGIEAHPSDSLTYDEYARLGGQTLSLFA